MNEEQRQEQASLYVLGLLTGDEAAAFARAMERDESLRRLVADFNEGLRLLAESAPRVAPPPELRAKALEAFRENVSERRCPPARVPAPPGSGPAASRGAPGARLRLFIPWTAAAGLAFAWLHLSNETRSLESELQTAQERAAARQTLAEQRRAEEETSRKAAERALETARRRERELEDQAAILTAEVESLRDAASLDKTRIALLSSQLKARPNAVAATVWNQTRQDGLLVVENLPALARGRDYQLWVIDSAGSSPAPVSAGIFKVDEKGAVRIRFKPELPVGAADKFAVTIEKEGGSRVPTLTQLVVIGG